MRQFRTLKVCMLVIMMLAPMLLFAPAVLGGTFQIVIEPPTEPIQPGVERKRLVGFAETVNPFAVGGFPLTYVEMRVTDKPDWASVILPEATLMLFPNARENFSVYVSVSEDAPAYRDGTVNIQIREGPFWLSAFGVIPYNFTQQIAIKAGYLPLLSPQTPPAKEGAPNHEVHHTITVENTGNARQLLQFSTDPASIPEGWGAYPPAPVYIDPGQKMDVSFSVLTPRDFGYVDQWATLPLTVKAVSALEGEQGRTQTYSIPTITHCVGYFVPGVPGGSNPAVIFGGLAAIIAVIVILIFAVFRYLREQKSKP